jgi:uncharacterized delta-60 repeat protein
MFMAAALLAYPVWRTYAAAGDLDTSFSSDGRWSIYEYQETDIPDVRIQIDPNNPTVEKLIVPTSDQLAYVNWSPLPLNRFYVRRLHPSGANDNSFGNSGTATINFGWVGAINLSNHRAKLTAIELQADGKILVAGILSYEVSVPSVVCVARLTFDGALDTTFGNNGVWYHFATAEINDMAWQSSNGKIVLAGRLKPSSNANWKSALWRLNVNGTLDSTFSSDGLFDTTVISGDQNDGGGFKSVYVQSDGKIVALNSSNSYRLRRVTSGGSLDSTLSVNAAEGQLGSTIKAIGSNIWIVGSQLIQGVSHGAVFARNNANGLVDYSFGGGDGIALSAQPSSWTDVAQVPFSFPAKYVIAGRNIYPPSTPPGSGIYPPRNLKAVVTRYSSTGVLDTNFGTNGSTETTGFTLSGNLYQHAQYTTVRIGLSGKIVAAGQCGNWDTTAPPFELGAVARYWNN